MTAVDFVTGKQPAISLVHLPWRQGRRVHGARQSAYLQVQATRRQSLCIAVGPAASAVETSWLDRTGLPYCRQPEKLRHRCVDAYAVARVLSSEANRRRAGLPVAIAICKMSDWWEVTFKSTKVNKANILQAKHHVHIQVSRQCWIFA